MNSVDTGTRAGLAVSSLFLARESASLDDAAKRSSLPSAAYAAEQGSRLRSEVARNRMLRASKGLS